MMNLDLISPLVSHRPARVDGSAFNQALAEKIKQHKVSVLDGKSAPPPPGIIRPEIVKSWVRSHNYGLNFRNLDRCPLLDHHDFNQRLQAKSDLLKAARPIIQQFCDSFLANDTYKIFLTDEQGVILHLQESVRRKFAEPSSSFQTTAGLIWNEETMGTCSHGLSLLLEKPLQICGPEHFFEFFGRTSCSAAPIFDANWNVTGSICLISPRAGQHSASTIGLIMYIAESIHNILQASMSRELLSAALESFDEAVLITNKKGGITRANIAARQIFGYTDQQLTGMKITDLLGEQFTGPALDMASWCREGDGKVEYQNQLLQVHSIRSLNDYADNPCGYVLTFGKIDRLHQTNRKEPEMGPGFYSIAGSAPCFLKALDMARKFSRVEENVLLQGESGTGKELFARAIHGASRPDGPFIAVNCAALPETLIESELFGYEGGSFTGAERQGRQGKIELAHHGTLFLDEIGDMPVKQQAVLLRVLEEKKVLRIGGHRYLPVDFRLITASNKDLAELVKKGEFREDLYFRLKVFKITIPALKERGSDIIVLARYFLDAIAGKQNIPVPSLSNSAILCLLQYPWPGNIRELRNAMLYAVNMSADGIITPADLPEEVSGTRDSDDHADHVKPAAAPDSITTDQCQSIQEMEKIAIIQALIQTGYNISAAAERLRLSRSTLYRRIKEYGLFNEITLQ